MSEIPQDVLTFYTHVPEGREFVLEIQFRSGRMFRLKSRLLMGQIARLLTWKGRAESATIRDFEGEVVVPPWTAKRMWSAKHGCYGLPTDSTLFTVRGSVGRGVEECGMRSFGMAIEYAIFYRDWDRSDWTHIVGPNGQIVLLDCQLRRMYHANERAHGEPATGRFTRTQAKCAAAV